MNLKFIKRLLYYLKAAIYLYLHFICQIDLFAYYYKASIPYFKSVSQIIVPLP